VLLVPKLARDQPSVPPTNPRMVVDDGFAQLTDTVVTAYIEKAGRI